MSADQLVSLELVRDAAAHVLEIENGNVLVIGGERHVVVGWDSGAKALMTVKVDGDD